MESIVVETNEIEMDEIENNISLDELNSIRDTIELMSKFNQIEVLRILSKHKKMTLNENKYGIHVNLSDLPNSLFNELKMYINYVNTQEITLCEVEQQKEIFKNIYFVKDNKDNNVRTNSSKINATIQ